MCEFCGCAGRRIARGGQADTAKPRSPIRMPVLSAPLKRMVPKPDAGGGRSVATPLPEVGFADRLAEPPERGAR